MHVRMVYGVGKGVLFREVSSVQRLKCMQEWYLGWEKVSCLERCSQFRGVLIERGIPYQNFYSQLHFCSEEEVLHS